MQLPDFKRSRILVAGDLMLDRYWHGGTSRISPEAPVPVVRVDEIEERAGGAGNVALNIAALGGRVELHGHCGNDEAGSALIALLESQGVISRIARSQHAPTITKLRIISRHQQLIRLDFEEAFHIDDTVSLQEGYVTALHEADLVILSDYGKGTLVHPEALIKLARELGKPVLVDPKGSDFTKYKGATLLTPNRHEFEAIMGPARDENHLVQLGEALREQLELEALLITRGSEGMTLISQGATPLHLSARAKEVYDVTGAGDTVIATLAAALASGMTLSEAAQLSNVAASIVVGKLGTATVNPEEVRQALHGDQAEQRGVIATTDILPVLKSAKARGERIVATNGCFDILHPGHVDYLRRARELGDRLIVLVNSDASVRRLKGPERPINALPHRMAMLAALECVDWVIPFEEDTPRDLIGIVLPDILVKGGDYTDIKTIAGHDHVLANGGQVEILEFVEGHSTTSIIERIHQKTGSA